jgi:transmembrane sensor
MNATAAIEAAAADWLTSQRDSGTWGEADQSAFDGWLAQSSLHEVAYLRLEAAWVRADRLAALSRPAMTAKSAPHRGGWRPMMFRAAGAAALAAIVAGARQHYFSKPDLQTYATPVGGQERITLSDGSQIELNTDTRLRANFSKDENKVWLEKGEAYFDIKHNPARKFVVMVNGHRVADLGTKFRVLSEPGHTEVALLEGKVSIDAAGTSGSGQPIVLEPGEVAIANSQSFHVVATNGKILADKLGWRRGVVVFDSVTLAEAAAELNRYNRKQVAITDPVTAQRRIAGTFRTNDIDGFIELAQDVLKLRVRRAGNTITISH